MLKRIIQSGFYSAIGVICLGAMFNWMMQTSKKTTIESPKSPAFLNAGEKWADSVLTKLTLEQKIAQSFMVAAYSDQRNNTAELKKLIDAHSIGGLIFFQGDIESQKKMTIDLQKTSRVPLLIGMDAEFGPGMRIKDGQKFPYQLTIGAAGDTELSKEIAYWIGRACADLGVHLNFSPVADINTNPKNPIIGFRSFGENPRNVGNHTVAFIEGMEHAGVLTCAKHFPGHGDTEQDSHLTLPLVNLTLKQFEAVNYQPFQRAIEAGVPSIMVAHLQVPALDSVNDVSSLSPVVIQEILQKQLKFQGLVISDALNMKGVTNQYGKDEAVVKAYLAGNDILLFPESVGSAILSIKNFVQSGKISEQEINRRCKKILKAKFWSIQAQKKVKALQNQEQKQLDMAIRKVIMKGATVIKNENQVLPLGDMSKKTAIIAVGSEASLATNRLLDYMTADVLIINTPSDLQSTLTKLSTYDRTISIFTAKHNWPNAHYGLPEFWKSLPKELIREKENLALFLANPYALVDTDFENHFDGIILGFENSEHTQDIVPQILVGAMPSHGKLPFSLNKLPRDFGFTYPANGRLQFVLPEELGLQSEKLAQIANIAQKGIQEKAYPGCQIVAAKDGKVFYRQNFGHLDYSQKQKVQTETLYDLASITKIASSTLSLMRLHDSGYLDVQRRFLDYLPDRVSNTPYGNLVLKNVLTHQAGLTPWIPFWKKTMLENNWNPLFYSTSQKAGYNQKVSENLWIRDDYRDSLFNALFKYNLNPQQGYKYSDLGYYFMQEIIEKHSKKTLDEFVYSTFYQPMGLDICYNPLRTHVKENIAPTEDDKWFRKSLIHGYVHDQGAAMLGGVAGHAGLFSNATDLAALMQMLLNNGKYGGLEYLSPEVIAQFTKCQFCASNRRALGFDKPVKNGGGPTCELASPESFGHTGFTGTIAWADPKTGINYVFLSNRVHPDAENKKLITMGTRTEIQRVIYEALNYKFQPLALF